DRDHAGLPVGVLSRPVDVGEGERRELELVQLTVGHEVVADCLLCDAVRRERTLRVRLPDREMLGLAVDRPGARREHDLGRARGAGPLGEQAVDERRADETGSARDERLHSTRLPPATRQPSATVVDSATAAPSPTTAPVTVARAPTTAPGSRTERVTRAPASTRAPAPTTASSTRASPATKAASPTSAGAMRSPSITGRPTVQTPLSPRRAPGTGGVALRMASRLARW